MQNGDQHEGGNGHAPLQVSTPVTARLGDTQPSMIGVAFRLMKLRRWGVVMTPVKGLGRRTAGRPTLGPSFLTRTAAEIEASRLDREMNKREDPTSPLLFSFSTARTDGLGLFDHMDAIRT